MRPESREHLAVAPSELLGRFWFDTLTHDDASLRFLLDRVGEDRLCLGSDYPFDMADPDPVGSVRRALADRPEVHEAMLEANPRALLTRRPGTERAVGVPRRRDAGPVPTGGGPAWSC